MDNTPIKPNRRKLTLGDFTSIIMTQITSPDAPIKAPRTTQGEIHDCK